MHKQTTSALIFNIHPELIFPSFAPPHLRVGKWKLSLVNLIHVPKTGTHLSELIQHPIHDWRFQRLMV